MHLTKKAVLGSLILIGALLLTACPSQETISKINADPGRYRNKEVGIVGNVTDSYGVLGNGAYEIDDGTGLLQGSGKDSRFIALSTRADAERPAVKRLVRKAFALEEGGRRGVTR